MTSYAFLFGAVVTAAVVFFTLRGITLDDIAVWRWFAFAGYLLLVGLVASVVAQFFITFPILAMALFVLLVATVYLLTRFAGLRVSDAARLSVPRRRTGPSHGAGGIK